MKERDKKMKVMLGGWHRVWIFISGIYLVVILGGAYSFYPDISDVSRMDIVAFVNAGGLVVEKKGDEQATAINENKTLTAFSNGYSQKEIAEYLQKEFEMSEEDTADLIDNSLQIVLKHKKLKFIFLSLLFWLIPVTCMYFLGRGINWIAEGFRKNRPDPRLRGHDESVK